jgi:hypothetical protein
MEYNKKISLFFTKVIHFDKSLIYKSIIYSSRKFVVFCSYMKSIFRYYFQKNILYFLNIMGCLFTYEKNVIHELDHIRKEGIKHEKSNNQHLYDAIKYISSKCNIPCRRHSELQYNN